MRVDWKTLLGLGITVLLFWWIFKDEDPLEIWNRIREANLPLLILAVTITTAGFAVRAMRWRIFLEPVLPESRFGPRFRAVCIGFMTNNLIVSGRLGELTRPYALSRMERVSMSSAFATLVIERVFDGVAILLLLFVAVFHPSFPTEGLPTAVTIGIRSTVAALTLLLVAMMCLALFPELGIGVLERVARKVFPVRWADRLVSISKAFTKGLESLRSPRLLALGLLWSVGFWLFHSLSFWVGLLAFDIHLPYVTSLFLNGTIALAVSVPSAPGFFGTFHAGAKVALVDVYGVAAAPALGFAFGWHFGSFFPVTLLGLWYARKLGLSLGAMREGAVGSVSETVTDEAPAAAGGGAGPS